MIRNESAEGIPVIEIFGRTFKPRSHISESSLDAATPKSYQHQRRLYTQAKERFSKSIFVTNIDLEAKSNGSSSSGTPFYRTFKCEEDERRLSSWTT